MKLCIDPGHGLSNREPGVFDTGAVRGALREVDMVMVWARELRAHCKVLGVETWMTRESVADPAPLRTRKSRAMAAGCTHFLSLHVNDSAAARANGVETFWREEESRAFAGAVHEIAARCLRLSDRGLKRGLFTVLTGTMPSALLELGFIGSAADMRAVNDSAVMRRTCGELAAHFAALAGIKTGRKCGCKR